MLEIAPQIYFVPGKNHARFPYCNCLYLQGRSHRVLIDAGMGSQGMTQVLEAGLDTIILTHSHIDHHLNRRLAGDLPVWCHEQELDYFKSAADYFHLTGIDRSGIDLHFLPASRSGDVFDFEIQRTIGEGDTFNLGGITLMTLHTPGHCPGHLSFYIPEHDLLFATDIDLTQFGPFYGHTFGDVDDFLASIERLEAMDYRTVVTGHAGPFDRSEAITRFKAFKEIIWEREERILGFLDHPKTLEDFRGSRLIYPRYPEDPDTEALTQWFELIHIEKNLKRLESQGAVGRENGHWFKK